MMTIQMIRRAPRAWFIIVAIGALVVLTSVHAGQNAADAGRIISADGCALRCAPGDHGYVIICETDDRIVMRSPDAGLFEIGTDMTEGVWPATWTSGMGQRVEHNGDWLIVHGAVDTPHGRWEIQDAYRAHGAVIKGVRRWTWRGDDLSPPTVLSIKFDTPATGVGLVLPGVLYHGNPSGQASRASGWNGLVPMWNDKEGERAFYQEHCYTAPYASMEWLDEASERTQFAALHTLPSYASGAVRDDLWWSLGATRTTDGTHLACLSGPVTLNDKPGMVKSGQRSATKLENTYIQIKPGGIVEKTFYLQAGDTTPGSGFRPPLAASVDIHQPYSCAGFPTVKNIVQDKLRFALSRYRADNPQPGFAMYPHHRNLYVMGWAGQSDAPGYALLQLADRLDGDATRNIATATLDALAEAPFNEHGFQLALDGATGEWSRQDPISQGQAMSTFARAIRAARRQNLDTPKWDAFLIRACDIHAQRILNDAWRPASTNEGFLIAPLCLAHELFGDASHQRAALKAAEHYADRHLTMNEPYWGGTLDARCEDKEGAWAGFDGFFAVYDMTGEQRWLDAAAHACDVALTYTVMWDIDMPPGRLRDHHLKTHGWTAVSVQNMHLDVFGVVYTPEIYRMGELLKREDLKRLAIVMYRSAGQMIDPTGSQGEQLQQTRFAQGGDLSNPEHFRGGYHETWSVFWITAHFLNAAAKFDELGVLDELWEME